MPENPVTFQEYAYNSICCKKLKTEKSSGAGESHPYALTDPDVTVSRHPALSVQPTVESPPPSEQTAAADISLSVAANASLGADGISSACTSASPTAQECG